MNLNLMKHTCDICHREFQSGIIKKCHHQKAQKKGIKYVCSYCCERKCKFSQKISISFGSGFICNYDPNAD